MYVHFLGATHIGQLVLAMWTSCCMLCVCVCWSLQRQVPFLLSYNIQKRLVCFGLTSGRDDTSSGARLPPPSAWNTQLLQVGQGRQWLHKTENSDPIAVLNVAVQSVRPYKMKHLSSSETTLHSCSALRDKVVWHILGFICAAAMLIRKCADEEYKALFSKLMVYKCVTLHFVSVSSLHLTLTLICV